MTCRNTVSNIPWWGGCLGIFIIPGILRTGIFYSLLCTGLGTMLIWTC